MHVTSCISLNSQWTMSIVSTVRPYIRLWAHVGVLKYCIVAQSEILSLETAGNNIIFPSAWAVEQQCPYKHTTSLWGLKTWINLWFQEVWTQLKIYRRVDSKEWTSRCIRHWRSLGSWLNPTVSLCFYLRKSFLTTSSLWQLNGQSFI